MPPNRSSRAMMAEIEVLLEVLPLPLILAIPEGKYMIPSRIAVPPRRRSAAAPMG